MKRLKDIDWSSVKLLLLVVVFFCVIFGYAAYRNGKENSAEEEIRAEVFTYKGHQYIKFKGHDLFGGSSVVHDPNCECQITKDSI